MRTAALTATFLLTGALSLEGWAQAQGVPDLIVSMTVNPNPVPFGMGYEVITVLSNPSPPATIRSMPQPDVGIAPPGTPAPPIRPATPVPGADVQQAEITFASTITGRYVSTQVQPDLRLDCQSQIGTPAMDCTTGALPAGGSWAITMVYQGNTQAPFTPDLPYPQTGVGYSVQVDPNNLIAERDEGNNVAGTPVWFLPSP